METGPRRALAAVSVAAGLGLAVAAAASLGGFGDDLGIGAGVQTIAGCDADGVDVRMTTNDSDIVTDVVISGIDDPGCDLAEVSVALSSGVLPTNATGGPVTVPVDEDILPASITITLNTTIAGNLVGLVHVIAVGP